MKQKTAFQRVMAFLLSAVMMLSLCSTAFAAQAGRVETRALSLHEEFSIVVNYGYMENGNFMKTGSKTMVSTCCDETGHSGYNHSMDAEKIVRESGYTYNDWRVTRYGYWDAPSNPTAVHYTISGKAPYKADEAIWVIGEKAAPVDPVKPGDGNGEGSDREETVRLGSSGSKKWKQTFVFHANYPGGLDPKVTVRYEITSYTDTYNAALKLFFGEEGCGFTEPEGYVLKTYDWYTQAEGGSVFRKFGGNYPFDKANNGKVIHLYAQYTPTLPPEYTFTMTYDANNGLVKNETSYTVSEKTTNTSYSFDFVDAVREGYTLQGWFTAADGGEKIEWPYVMSVSGSETSASKTVYAHWQANEVPYTVTWLDNEENVIKTDSRNGVTDQTVAVTDEDKTLEGYTFNETDERNVLQTVLGSGNNELKLYFTKNTPNWEQLQITQTADKDKVRSTETVTYTIEVTNNTGFDLTNVTVTDQLVANAFCSGMSENGKYVGTTGAAWTIDSLAKGEMVTMTMTAMPFGTAMTGTEIKAVATVTGATAGVETLPENVRPQKEATVIVDNSPDWEKLTITQEVSQPKARSGMNVLFTIRVTNNTDRDLTNVTVADQMDNNLHFVSDNGAGRYVNNVWTIGALKKGETAVLTITAQMMPGTSSPEKVTNIATIQTAAAGTEMLPAGEGAKAEAEVTVDYSTAPAWIRLRLVQYVDKTTVNPGGKVTFLVQVRNKTMRNLTNITVVDVLDPSLKLIGVNPETEKGNYDETTGIWTIPSLNMGEWASLELTVEVDEAAAFRSLLKNTATITEAFADYEELPWDVSNYVNVYVAGSGTGTNRIVALPQ